MKKDNPLRRLIRGTPGLYVQNQKFQIFEDRRTKRNRSRSEKKRRALEEQKDTD